MHQAALRLGSPSAVDISMKYGLMNIKVVIQSAVNAVVEVTGIELSRLISAQTVELKKMIEKIPLH
jgi:hypothetical protein